LDLVYQRWQLSQRMMMSVQEVRDEHRESEGDPQIKAKRKQRQRQLATRQSLAKVALADVVVTNPTHYAIALRYRRQENAAPVVVARGLDHLALQIRQEAMRNDVMVIENRPLARALYAKAKVGAAIPAEFYPAVAEVLAVVYRRRRRKAG
jgi:flagellar biosynthetic protein FlhB